MGMYYSCVIEISLKNHGNTAIAVMHWFNDGEEWPYDEWGEEVELSDIKMMTEKDIEKKIKEELKKAVKREFDINKLTFEWRVR